MNTSNLNSSVLQGAIAFTGKLASMTRAEAFALVRQHGGSPSETVSKKTKAVVVGELGWPLLDDGRPSKKLSAAASYAVPTVSERRFLEWIGRAAPDTFAKTYTAEQLAALSGLSTERLDELARLGILTEREGLFGFRELAAARQVAKLLAADVPLSSIIRSLHEIRQWLPEAGLANLRLTSEGPSLLLEQAQGRTNTKGQFVLPVAGGSEHPDALFDQAQQAEESGDVGTAERLYTSLIRSDPSDPAPAFNLGNLLRSMGRKVEAEAAFRKAVAADRRFGEAWYNLSDLLDEQGRVLDAIDCLQRAIKADPDYIDALFNLALLLQRTDRHQEAAKYWREYLSRDSQSDWASRAKRSLKYCEMSAALSTSEAHSESDRRKKT
jgi:tetratricopeptide (TPR) repeat protein